MTSKLFGKRFKALNELSKRLLSLVLIAGSAWQMAQDNAQGPVKDKIPPLRGQKASLSQTVSSGLTT